jgi:hypothetical protein
MKKHFRFGWIFASLFMHLFSCTALAGELLVYPVPKGAPTCRDFLVEVRQGGDWQQVGTYAWLIDNPKSGIHCTDTTSIASFDFTGEVEVRITPLHARIDSFSVRPFSYSIKAKRIDQSIIFTLNRSRYLSVEVNGDRVHNLQIFANPVIPAVKKGKGVIRMKPGYYDLGNDSIKVGSGQTLYIPGGTYIKGWVSVWKANGAKVIGTGIVNPERQHEGIMVRYSKNVEVNGPLTTQIPCGESDSVDICNAKVISWYGWGDGMNVFASNNVNYNNVFCRTSDDCSTIYCTRKGYRGSCRNIHVNNAVYWADVAHPIMIGLHGDIDKNEEISDVVYENVNILRHNEMQLDYQGCIGINNGDNILCRNLAFRNFHIEDIENGMLFNFRVCFNKKYCHAPGRGISNVLVENLNYHGRNPNISLIMGYSPDRRVENIRFCNLTINGLKIRDDMKQKPSWYKTADFARIFLGEHADGIVFK